MRSRLGARRAGLALAAAVILGAAAAHGQGQSAAGGERCNLLGQIAVSEWLDLLSVLGGGAREAVDMAMERTHRAAALYAAAACPAPQLTAAMDCVLVSDGGASPRARARQCLADSGLAQNR